MVNCLAFLVIEIKVQIWYPHIMTGFNVWHMIRWNSHKNVLFVRRLSHISSSHAIKVTYMHALGEYHWLFCFVSNASVLRYETIECFASLAHIDVFHPTFDKNCSTILSTVRYIFYKAYLLSIYIESPKWKITNFSTFTQTFFNRALWIKPL